MLAVLGVILVATSFSVNVGGDISCFGPDEAQAPGTKTKQRHQTKF